jgi:hypothetical protein
MGTLSDPLRQKAADAVANAFEAADSVLEIGTSAMGTVLATFDIAATQPAADASGVWTLDFDADTVVASGTGTAAAAQIRDDTAAPSDTITGLTVTITSGGGDVELDGLGITSGQNVTLTSVTITMPAATA